MVTESSSASRVRPFGNGGTVLGPILALTFSPRLLEVAFEALVKELFRKLDPDAGEIVIAVASPSTGEFGGGTILPQPRGTLWSAVLGRHEMCPLSLSGDEALSLRQVIVIASMTDDGCPITRVLDLRSGTGMIDAAGAMHESVITNGPLRVRIGNSALFAIPTGDLFRGGRIVGYDEIAWPTPVRWLPVSSTERQLDEFSRVSSSSSVISLASEVERRARRMRRAINSTSVGSFVVEVDGARSEIDVDGLDLRSGVLFGRYPRCDISCTNAPMSDGISRVHALFLMVDEKLRVFDTGSTNGIVCRSSDADGLSLPVDRESRLSLYKGAAITWRPNRAA